MCASSLCYLLESKRLFLLIGEFITFIFIILTGMFDITLCLLFFVCPLFSLSFNPMFTTFIL